MLVAPTPPNASLAMARSAVAVKHEDADPGAGDGPKASKRRCVQSACVPCRKRKSKVGNPDDPESPIGEIQWGFLSPSPTSESETVLF